MIVPILCIIAAVAESSSSQEYKCESMIKSFRMLCPGSTMYCPKIGNVVGLNRRLRKALAEAQQIIQKLKNDDVKRTEGEQKCSALGGLYYNSICYTLPYFSTTRLIKLDEAITRCRETGALLGEIHNQDQLRAIQKFIEPRIPSSKKFAYVWLGMKYDHKRRILTYRSGEILQVGQLKWDHSYPKGNHPHVVLEVGTDGDDSAGLWNTHNIYDNDAVLCEMKV